MIDFSEAKIQQIIVHKVGNKSEDEGVEISEELVNLEENPISELLTDYFLKPFKNNAYEYQFVHESSIDLNEMYVYTKSLFSDNTGFVAQSVNMVKHLYETSDHPQIKSGELYVALFRNIYYEGDKVDALGLFKSENKETFLKVYKKDVSFQLSSEQGIDIKKLDKGCLVFNTDAPTGYKVVLVDNTNRSEEAQYWKNHFLKVQTLDNDFLQTKNYMNMCRDFVKEVFNKAHNVEKADQIDMLNRSLDYFKENDTFVESDFKDSVIQFPEVIDAFDDYKQTYQDKKQIQFTDDAFAIDNQAFKKEQKGFKSILKLDKNFHIYIHGDRHLIEKGWDEEKAMNYYKLYFNEEN